MEEERNPLLTGEDFITLTGFKQFLTGRTVDRDKNGQPTGKILQYGDSIIGEYLGYITVPMPNPSTGKPEHVNIYAVMTEEGLVRFVGTAQMRILMGIPAGTRIFIEYLREEAKGARKTRVFDIRFPRSGKQMLIKYLTDTGGVQKLIPEQTAEHSEEEVDDPFANDPKLASKE